ncbi:MAG: alanyl-tRNA editing protein [Alphaproteobacteria bacterium]|nr:alanyl-tRNA editing protein [Alphaproteobacteria bacterium]
MQLVFRDDAYAKSCAATVVAVDGRGVRLDRTVFYPTGGGQPGDSGLLRLAGGGTLAVTDAIKGDGPDDVIHVLAEGMAPPAPGTAVTAEIDWARRHRHMRMHTALHLLCAVVPRGVTGGQIGDGKGRLDFDIQDTVLDKEAITAELNARIAADRPVTPSTIAEAELAANPELVRTMSVKPPSSIGEVRVIEIEGVDLQPCGGTHVRRTGEIGRVVVTKIENKGKRNRRVNLAFAEE